MMLRAKALLINREITIGDYTLPVEAVCIPNYKTDVYVDAGPDTVNLMKVGTASIIKDGSRIYAILAIMPGFDNLPHYAGLITCNHIVHSYRITSALATGVMLIPEDKTAILEPFEWEDD